MSQYNRYISLHAVIITAFPAMNTTLKQTTAVPARTITLMLTREEHDLLMRAAARLGMTLSEYFCYAVKEQVINRHA